MAGVMCLTCRNVGADSFLLVELENRKPAVPDAAACWNIIRSAERPNGAIILDVWHHFRGSDDDDQIRSIPSDKIVAAAISDAAEEIVGDLIEDTTTRRLIPGEGSFDLVRLIRVLDGMGVDVPMSVEILSRAQNTLPTHEAATRA